MTVMSSPTTYPAPRSSAKGKTAPSAVSSLPTRTGNADVRERTGFRGSAWKPRRLELDGETLTIVNPTSSKRTRVPLSAILAIERTDLAAHSLGIRILASYSKSAPATSAATGGKTTTLALSFATDAALYDWQDDIYARSPLGRYTSGPFDFVHKAHVGADMNGSFGDTNILPIYAEIIGGAPGAVASSAIPPAGKPRSRPVSGVVLTKAGTSPIAVVNSGAAQAQAKVKTTVLPAPTEKQLTPTKRLEGQVFLRLPGDGFFARLFSPARYAVFRSGDNATPGSELIEIYRGASAMAAPALVFPLERISRAAQDARKREVLVIDLIAPNEATRLAFTHVEEAAMWAGAIGTAQNETVKARLAEAARAEKEAQAAREAQAAEKQAQADKEARAAKRQSRGERRRSGAVPVPAMGA